jgi:NHL repeat
MRILLPLLLLTITAGFAGEVKFTTRPTAARAGEKVKITFAVSRETDVAVFVLNARGKVIRHLVAGVLGKNPPKPLKSGLSQALEWDGKADYGKKAEGGPFKARVAIGLGARYDKVVSSDRQSLSAIYGLGVGPRGTLYVLTCTRGAVWQGPQILAFNRNGSYKRMIVPFPAGLKKEQLRGFSTINLEGRPAPLVRDVVYGLYPELKTPSPVSLAVSPDGDRLYIPLGRKWKTGRQPAGIAVVDAEGGCPEDRFALNLDLPGRKNMFQAYTGIVVSSDGKHAFLSGLSFTGKKRTPGQPAVFRVSLPSRTGCKPFFGDPARAGKGKTHLGSPRGLATDGKGRLYVADHANNRVVIISEKDGIFIDEFEVSKPDYVGVDSKAGTVYVSSLMKTEAIVTKFRVTQDTKGAKELYRLSLPLRKRASRHTFALDTSIQPVVVWHGGSRGLFRIEDLGGKFGEPTIISKRTFSGRSNPLGVPANCHLSVVVDRRRKEIYTRNSPGGGLWLRYCEKTGKLEKVVVPKAVGGGGKGYQIVPHPDGNLYGLRWPFRFLKWDRNGKPIPWESPISPPEGIRWRYGSKGLVKLPPSTSFVRVCMVELPHTLGIRQSDGHSFVFSRPWGESRSSKILHEYLPSGKRVSNDPVIWKASDAVVGPKFDAAGNIYVAEAVKPDDWLYPPELAAAFARKGIANRTVVARVAINTYGSIVKFTPKGGMFETEIRHRSFVNPFKGQPKLAPGLKPTKLQSFFRGKMYPGKVIGAEWVHPGIGHVGHFRCNCENVTFDVDEFGRVFFPDPILFQIRVIDTNGNALTRFGGYGNAENMGVESPVPDPKTGQLRPPRHGERSPFGEPDIAFAWLVGVGVTDRYIYAGDSLNRRMLKLKMTYKADETCAIK